MAIHATVLVHRHGHSVFAKTFLHDEGLGRVDQLFQVLDAVLAFFVGLVKIHQARGVQHVLNDRAQCQTLGRGAHTFNAMHKGQQIAAALARHTADALHQTAATGTCCVLQQLDGARANAARREVHHTQKTGVVVGVFNQAQVRQRVLHLGALEKSQAAIHAVGHAGVKERAFDHTALRVAAVEHGNLAARRAATVQLLGFFKQPLCLGKVAGRLDHTQRLASARVGAQRFTESRRVV